MIIRKGRKNDLPQVLLLIKELAVYEKAAEEVNVSIKELAEDGFGKQKFYHLIVAELNKKIVGIALYYIAYSTWKGKIIYLDDLIVTESMRGKRIGEKLFKTLVKEAKKLKVKQLRWHVLNWNTPAINFYKKHNASLDPEWITGKLNFRNPN